MDYQIKIAGKTLDLRTSSYSTLSFDVSQEEAEAELVARAMFVNVLSGDNIAYEEQMKWKYVCYLTDKDMREEERDLILQCASYINEYRYVGFCTSPGRVPMDIDLNYVRSMEQMDQDTIYRVKIGKTLVERLPVIDSGRTVWQVFDIWITSQTYTTIQLLATAIECIYDLYEECSQEEFVRKNGDDDWIERIKSIDFSDPDVAVKLADYINDLYEWNDLEGPFN